MTHTNIFAILLASIIGLLPSSTMAAGENTKHIVPPPQQLTEHVYAWIGPLDGPNKENQGYRMNMLFIVGKKAVAVVDTGYTPAMANEMLAHIKRITPLPVKYAINSNSQPHRFMGNPVFAEAGATIIAHEKSVARMKKQAGNFAAFIENILELKPGTINSPPLPNKIIKGDTEIDLGGLTLKIWDFGAAHTPTQLVIEIAEDKLVYTGDLLYSGRLLAVIPDSNVKNWIAAYDRLKQFKGVTFVPGHGEPAELAAFDFPTRQYLTLLFEHMTKMVEDGVDIQDAINQLDQSRYSKLANYEVLAGRNASWTFIEREAAAFD